MPLRNPPRHCATPPVLTSSRERRGVAAALRGSLAQAAWYAGARRHCAAMASRARTLCLLRRETHRAGLERRAREPAAGRLDYGYTWARGQGPCRARCVWSRISNAAASTLRPCCLQVSVHGQNSKQTSFPTVSPVAGSCPHARGMVCTERLHPCCPPRRRGRAQVRDVRAQGHLRRRRGGPSLHALVLRCRRGGPPGRRRSRPALVNPV